ncbi:MAG: tetraacyldisaccharide 4'-kinase [Desulfobacterales bacterium]|nr:tetraacyldisaccharide 4'-kinase [Desulfobacterales bacterium]
MSLLGKKIETVMIHGSEARLTSFFETFLYLISLMYAGVVSLRALLYEKGFLKSRRLSCTVISIGNITVGGTGKTPLTIYVAGLLKHLGYKVAVVSRGYRGGKERSGGIVSDGEKIRMSPEAAGDEPYLMALRLEGVPVLVGRHRFEIGMLALREFAPDILVLDDAFQQLQLNRDLDIVLLDAARPFGNSHLIPRGILREPLSGLIRGDAFTLSRSDPDAVMLFSCLPVIRKLVKGKPIFRCTHVPAGLFFAGQNEPLDLASVKGRRLFIFSGIARNDSFRETVSKLGGHIAGFLEFPDHHRYSRYDLRLIWEKAGASNVDNIITTEKDYVNICTDIPPAPLLLVLAISISFGHDEEAFISYLKDKVAG